MARTSWHVESLWLAQTHLARHRRSQLWAQRTAIASFLSGLHSYMQVDVVEPAMAELRAAVAGAGTFHELEAAHTACLAALAQQAFLDKADALDLLQEILRASHEFARRMARALSSTLPGYVVRPPQRLWC